MKRTEYNFSGKKVNCVFDAGFDYVFTMAQKSKLIFLTDEQVFELHREKFTDCTCICIPTGEKMKTQQTVDLIINRLIELEADKQTYIIGVGGGVITDIAGYVAGIFKRGMKFALVPTTILAMVDAAIGGKNGVDVGYYKNMVGTIYQPEFIVYDYSFLNSLPVKEWINGFAEIIKHACIKDPELFVMLEENTLHHIQSDKPFVASLVERNVAIKMDIVTTDEFEKADRKLLNFGHTFGHALENLHQLPHGNAISIGMVAACNLSEKINGLHFDDAQRVVKLLAKYHLPVDIETDYAKVFEVLKLDKKREDEYMHFVLLNKIGEAEAKPVQMKFLQENIKQIL